MRRVILWVMQTGFYRWLLRDVIPYVRFSTYYPSLRGAKYWAGLSILKPGDIIVTTDDRKLTSFLIPGTWSHAAFCLTKFPKQHPGGSYEIAEMTAHGYTKSYFFDLCKEADRVAIFRCRDFDPLYIMEMVDKCLEFEGSRYDAEFELGVEALYCSELIYQADFERRLQVDLSDLAGLGRPYLSPDGLALARNVECVWDSSWGNA